MENVNRTVNILKLQFQNLESGYRNISAALTNIVSELEKKPDEDIILKKVDNSLNLKDVESLDNHKEIKENILVEKINNNMDDNDVNNSVKIEDNNI